MQPPSVFLCQAEKENMLSYEPKLSIKPDKRAFFLVERKIDLKCLTWRIEDSSDNTSLWPQLPFICDAHNIISV